MQNDLPQQSQDKKTQPNVTREPVSAPTLPFIIRGNLHEYTARIGVARPLLAFALSLLLWWRLGFVVWILTVLFLVVLIGVGFALIKRRSLAFDDRGLTYRNFIGKTTNIAYGNIESAKVFLGFVDYAFGPTPRLSIVDAAHSQLVSLQGLYWSAEDMQKATALLEAQKVKVEVSEDITSYVEIAREHPQYATVLERHPYRIAFIALPIIIALIFVIAALITFN